MSDPAPLPDLHQSELDEATLRQLFDDVRAHTELMEVIPKHAAAAYVPEIAAITLAEGLDLLLAVVSERSNYAIAMTARSGGTPSCPRRTARSKSSASSTISLPTLIDLGLFIPPHPF